MNRELAEVMGRHEGSISRLKKWDKMPELGGDDLDDLCNALTQILKSKGIEKTVYPSDLLSSESID